MLCQQETQISDSWFPLLEQHFNQWTSQIQSKTEDREDFHTWFRIGIEQTDSGTHHEAQKQRKKHRFGARWTRTQCQATTMVKFPITQCWIQLMRKHATCNCHRLSEAIARGAVSFTQMSFTMNCTDVLRNHHSTVRSWISHIHPCSKSTKVWIKDIGKHAKSTRCIKLRGENVNEAHKESPQIWMQDFQAEIFMWCMSTHLHKDAR